jgi:hypothetical protein
MGKLRSVSFFHGYGFTLPVNIPLSIALLRGDRIVHHDLQRHTAVLDFATLWKVFSIAVSA